MSIKAYIAGPMSGYPQYNIPAFDAAAWALRARGWTIISPAELDDPEVRAACLQSPDGGKIGQTSGEGGTWGDFLARDVKIVADQIDAIVLLPGWENSKGANLEAFVGTLCKKTFYLYNSGKPMEVAPAYVLGGMKYFQG
jgi:hypothetical protein